MNIPGYRTLEESTAPYTNGTKFKGHFVHVPTGRKLAVYVKCDHYYDFQSEANVKVWDEQGVQWNFVASILACNIVREHEVNVKNLLGQVAKLFAPVEK